MADPSSSLSRTQQRRAAGLLVSAVRAKHIDRQRRAPGSNSDAARATARCSAANAGNVMLRDELRRLNTDGIISILLQFQQYSLLVQLCVKM